MAFDLDSISLTRLHAFRAETIGNEQIQFMNTNNE